MGTICGSLLDDDRAYLALTPAVSPSSNQPLGYHTRQRWRKFQRFLVQQATQYQLGVLAFLRGKFVVRPQLLLLHQPVGSDSIADHRQLDDMNVETDDGQPRKMRWRHIGHLY